MRDLIIHTDSLFYRFLRTNFIASQWHIPDNLCPFMRKVVAASCITAFCFTLAGFLLMTMLFAPIALFVNRELWGPGWDDLVAIGIGVWGVSLGSIAVIGWLVLCDKYHPVRKATEHVANLGPMQTTAAWYRAVHDKVCPRLSFFTPEKENHS